MRRFGPPPFLTSALLSAFPNFAHGFSTRDPIPGSATFPFLGGPIHAVNQVHGAKVVRVDRPSASGGEPVYLGDGDALVTATPGVALGIRTADCAPILVIDPVHGAAAAIHAGWRGTRAGIVEETLRFMGRHWNCRAIDLRVAIGPCISQSHYEVGGELPEAFPKDGGQFKPSPNPSKWLMDLPGILLRQFATLGVPEGAIEWTGHCTFADAARFSSFRREGAASTRQWSVIQIVKTV